jgi:flagellar motor switch protein FliG
MEISKVDSAAILLLALGADRAGEVLKHMTPKEVTILGSAMGNVGDISVDMMDEVLEEFIITVKRQTALGLDGEDYIRSVMINALGEDKANGILERITQGGNNKGLEQLKWMDTRSVADMIRTEHPQIIATIMSLMESEQAADVLLFLPKEMHPDLMMRVATMKGIQPAALRELDQIMEQQLTGSDNVKSTNIGGVNAVAGILNLLDSEAVESVIAGIAEQRTELALEIQEKMFTFEDLYAIDQRGMQTLLREVSVDLLLLALRGVSDDLKEKIFNNMSKRAAEMLRDDLEAAPPTKLSEVESAQKEILDIARKLADSGEIMMAGAGDELI